jgi:hypothetical protein
MDLLGHVYEFAENCRLGVPRILDGTFYPRSVPTYDVKLSPDDHLVDYASRVVRVEAPTEREAGRIALALYGGIWAQQLTAEVVRRQG